MRKFNRRLAAFGVNQQVCREEPSFDLGIDIVFTREAECACYRSGTEIDGHHQWGAANVSLIGYRRGWPLPAGGCTWEKRRGGDLGRRLLYRRAGSGLLTADRGGGQVHADGQLQRVIGIGVQLQRDGEYGVGVIGDAVAVGVAQLPMVAPGVGAQRQAEVAAGVAPGERHSGGVGGQPRRAIRQGVAGGHHGVRQAPQVAEAHRLLAQPRAAGGGRGGDEMMMGVGSLMEKLLPGTLPMLPGGSLLAGGSLIGGNAPGPSSSFSLS